MTENHKPLLVFLHGWKGKVASWEKNIPYLEKAGYECLAIKMPGFDLPEPTTAMGVPEYSEYVVKEIEAKYGDGKKFTLIGHSFGGRLTIYITSTFPELIDRLVLSDSAGLNLEPKGIRKGLYFISDLFKKVERKLPVLAKFRVIAIKLMGSKNYKDATLMMREILKKVVDLDLKNRLQDIRCPTLIVWGDMDLETPMSLAKVLNKEIIGSELKVISGAGHHSHKTHFEEWNKIVGDFFSKT